MKTIIASTIATTSLIGLLQAFPPSSGRQSVEIIPPFIPGDLTPLEELADKFAAFKKAFLHGEAYYSKADAGIQKIHSETYLLITDYYTSDRITEEEATSYITQLASLGRENKSMLNGKSKLTQAENKEATISINELQAKIKKESVEQVNVDILTPEINRVQLTMHELRLFTRSDDKLSNKTSSLTRRYDDISYDLEKIKKDGQVSDYERKKMMRTLTDIWTQYVAIIIR